MNNETLYPKVQAGRRGRRILAALAIFVSGAICGVAASHAVLVHVIHHTMEHPEDVSRHIANRLAGYLDLTADQKFQVQKVLERRQAALSSLRRQIQPQLEQELSQLEEEVAVVLNDSQRVKWREHAKQVRNHWLPPIPQ